MMQSGFKQSYLTIASLESKSTWDSLQEISYTQKILHFLLFFPVLYVNIMNEKWK